MNSSMDKNELLKRFLKEVENAEEDMFDIKHLMTGVQRSNFDKLENVVATLFSADNLYAGLETTIEEEELSNNQQVSVLVFLKIFETFLRTVSTLGGNTPTPDEIYGSSIKEPDGGMYS